MVSQGLRPEQLFYDVLRNVEEINLVSAKLERSGRGVFLEVMHRIPKLTPAELGFLRSVSWFYVL